MLHIAHFIYLRSIFNGFPARSRNALAAMRWIYDAVHVDTHKTQSSSRTYKRLLSPLRVSDKRNNSELYINWSGLRSECVVTVAARGKRCENVEVESFSVDENPFQMKCTRRAACATCWPWSESQLFYYMPQDFTWAHFWFVPLHWIHTHLVFNEIITFLDSLQRWCWVFFLFISGWLIRDTSNV